MVPYELLHFVARFPETVSCFYFFQFTILHFGNSLASVVAMTRKGRFRDALPLSVVTDERRVALTANVSTSEDAPGMTMLFNPMYFLHYIRLKI